MQKIETFCKTKNEIKLIEGWYGGPEDKSKKTGAIQSANGVCGGGNGGSNTTKTKLNAYLKTDNVSTRCPVRCPNVKIIGSGVNKRNFCSSIQ